MVRNDKYHRRSVRLASYDYRAGGAYFITVCASRRGAIFGTIADGEVHLNSYGRIVAEEWERTGVIRSYLALDEWIIMPDHFHAIIMFHTDASTNDNVGTPRRVASCQVAPLPEPRLQAGSLGAVVGQFKSIVTKRLNAHRAERGLAPVAVWQRSFYDRIIRSETELLDTRRYIIENPLRW